MMMYMPEFPFYMNRLYICIYLIGPTSEASTSDDNTIRIPIALNFGRMLFKNDDTISRARS